jgi:serine/threonine-protein kinase
VGAIGYFLLAGAPPFTGRTVAEVCAHHLHTTPRPLPRDSRVPPALEALLLRCLAKSPEDRPESAATLRAELLELASTWTEQEASAWWAEHDGDLPSLRQPRLLEAAGRTELAPTYLALAG